MKEGRSAYQGLGSTGDLQSLAIAANSTDCFPPPRHLVTVCLWRGSVTFRHWLAVDRSAVICLRRHAIGSFANIPTV